MDDPMSGPMEDPMTDPVDGRDNDEVERIAVVGMAGRFPGASDINEFWLNLRAGKESIDRFSDDDLAAAGVPASWLSDPNYVKAGTVVKDVDCFDAGFFGYTPREARQTDPQQRIFLESAWAALEDAGYDPGTYEGDIGVFAGAGMNNYAHRLEHDAADPIGEYQKMIGNQSDFLATRVAYMLNLRGQSLTVQTACSTSLVAIHLAAQSLLTYQCDMALAGGVSLWLPQGWGYFHREGMILSPDGHCRAFDAAGQGTVGGRGLGIVVLKRLSEALEDGDNIRAVLLASAVNNDGAAKIGYTAPSVDGQAAAIATALQLAEVNPETIGYVEAHGTGTTLGDPIEIAALTAAYREQTEQQGYCAIGSVKTNIGHLDTAAGVAGFIKTVLALENREIPASLHYTTANNEIDFKSSPFFVNTELRPWLTQGDTPRRASVSSFGIGGTNAHAILEEAPLASFSVPDARPQLLVVSARSAAAVDQQVEQLCAALNHDNAPSLDDVAFTLQQGRKSFKHRRSLVARQSTALPELDRWRSGVAQAESPLTVFAFSGQGSQYVGMGAALYQQQPVFRETFDQCNELLKPLLHEDLTKLLFTGDSSDKSLSDALQQTAIAQPALFSLEYALFELWRSLGIQPHAMAGHSIGEYTAACAAGVMGLEDALSLVARRGELMQSLPAGSMLAIASSAEEVAELLPAELDIAAINGPAATVVSGDTHHIDELRQQLSEKGLRVTLLRTSHAFHSAMMDPILDEFAHSCAEVTLNAPSIPIVSNVTGDWMTAAQATDAQYWVKHLRSTVRFMQCVNTLLADGGRALVELGPGQTLASLAQQTSCPAVGCFASLPGPSDKSDASDFFLDTVGKLWLNGVQFDWRGLNKRQACRRVSLPTYAFERTRFWLDDKPVERATQPEGNARLPDIAAWFSVPTWQRQPLGAANAPAAGTCLVLTNDSTVSVGLSPLLSHAADRVISVTAGTDYQDNGEDAYVINPVERSHYIRVFEQLREDDCVPENIVHLWTTDDSSHAFEQISRTQRLGLESIVSLVQAWHEVGIQQPLVLSLLTTGAHDVIGESLSPAKSLLLAVAKSIAQEYPGISTRAIDLTVSFDHPSARSVIQDICRSGPSGDVIAYRGGHRWLQTYQSLPLPAVDPKKVFRSGGVYLITGGLGGIGYAIAEYLARHINAQLVLLGRNLFSTADETVVKRIADLQQLDADVLVLQADVTQKDQMQRAVAEAEERFGRIHGVIHAAGSVPQTGSGVVQALDHTTIAQQLQPKVRGVQVLSEVFADKELDFCVLTSSLASILGGIGLGAYAAANSYMDAFVSHHCRQSAQRWISINWDAWQSQTDTIAERGMSREEGLDTFTRIVAQNMPGQFIVSTVKLDALLQQWIKLQPTEFVEPKDKLLSSAPKSALTTGTETEKLLHGLWRELLGVESIALNDNYYELGGDSLLGMNVVSRINMAGFTITPQQLIENPTIEALALICESHRTGAHTATAAASLIKAEAPNSGVVLGDLPLTPNFLRYLSRKSSLHHWNVSVFLQTTHELDSTQLQQAVAALEMHHDTLRSRFSEDASGWRRYLIEPDVSALPLSYHDLSQLATEQRTDQLHEIAAEINAGFDFSNGPLYHIALIDLGENEHRLLLVTHHFLAEGMSLGTLCDDLGTACRQVRAGMPIEFPPKTASIRQWAISLQNWADSRGLKQELNFWRELNWSACQAVPCDMPKSESALLNQHARQVKKVSSSQHTEILLRSRTASTEELLLAAFAEAYADWSEQDSLLIDRIGHGRTVQTPELLDVSRTAGFFLSYTPVLLDVKNSEYANASTLLPVIRNFLMRGQQFDVLRWMSSDATLRSELADYPVPEVSFNYRGRIDRFLPPDSIFEIAPERLGKHVHNPDGHRYYPLGVVMDVIDDELNIRMVYSLKLHKPESIERLATLFVSRIAQVIETITEQPAVSA